MSFASEDTSHPNPPVKHGNGFKDWTGTKYERLFVIELYDKGPRGLRWKCRCDCGKIGLVYSSDLGKNKSCGCYSPEASSVRNRTHGLSHTPEHNAWEAMKQRCSSRVHYTSRGIKVCDRWLHSFENFLKDMGPRPSPRHSIDRKNNNGDYEPGNCRWATHTEQMQNTRRTKRFEFNGANKTITEWANEVGMRRETLRARLKNGWSIKEAITTPIYKT